MSLQGLRSMFDEIMPLGRAFTQQPVAFLGGVVTGALRLNPQKDPLKTWLTRQGIGTQMAKASQGSGQGPETIEID
ncbi:MAG: hypothetical protein F6J87_15080 [Spirulina sp. SIO3F2]|nr:hypothetical protein [Spirulina sp. SIO3F2]